MGVTLGHLHPPQSHPALSRKSQFALLAPPKMCSSQVRPKHVDGQIGSVVVVVGGVVVVVVVGGVVVVVVVVVVRVVLIRDACVVLRALLLGHDGAPVGFRKYVTPSPLYALDPTQP